MRHLSARIDIEAPAALVWEVLADFGDVAVWAPYMRTSHLIGPQESGRGTRRAMQHSWGFRFEEVVTEWAVGKGFSFDVFRAPFPMKDVHETWQMSHRNGCTTVATKVTYGMRLGPLGRLLDWLLVRYVVRREMTAGLRGLKEYSENEAERMSAIQFAD